MDNEILFSKEILQRFESEVKKRYPKKAFGYFLSVV